MSELCLTQFTRKRVGTNVLSSLVKPCQNCTGKGHVHDDIFVITRLRDALLDCFANGFSAAIVDLNENIMQKILKENLFTPETKGLWKEKRIYFVPHKTYREELFNVRGDNSSILDLPNNAQILY
jgi:Ribonuclease G/E